MLRRPLALILLGDGLITVFWGPGFLHWQRRLAPRWYRPVLNWLLRWPDPMLRLGAAAEAFVGWRRCVDEMTWNARETRATRARYDRVASLYDFMEALIEPRYSNWRERAWSLVTGPRVLEVGVGTGKNIPYYPPGAHVTGVDLSERMLARARRRTAWREPPVTLIQMDVQALDFPDDAFESAIATFVFCSVPDPIMGLREMARVVKPGGRIVLLEHVRSENPLLGRLMDWLDPLVVWLMGPHINRRTVENVRRVGLTIERVQDLGAGGVFKLIVVRKDGTEEAI